MTITTQQTLAGHVWKWNPLLWLCLGLVWLFSSCVPNAVSQPQGAQAEVQANFGPEGVVWSANGSAYLARAPQFEVQQLLAPADISAVSWYNGRVWMAVPQLRSILAAEGAVEQYQLGYVVQMSPNALYLRDGAVLNYQGQLLGVLDAAPRAVWSQDKTDYLVVGAILYQYLEGKLTVLQKGVSLQAVYIRPKNPVGSSAVTVEAVPISTRSQPNQKGIWGQVGNTTLWVGPTGQISIETNRK